MKPPYQEQMMSELVYEDILLDADEQQNMKIMFLPSSVGTFSLRRVGYFTKAGKLLLSTEQARALAELTSSSDPAAKQRAIVHYLRKVVNIARHYSNHGLALLDLVNEGIAGLIQAIQKFDIEGGFRFSSYASQCIRQNIERAITNRTNPAIALQAAPSA